MNRFTSIISLLVFGFLISQCGKMQSSHVTIKTNQDSLLKHYTNLGAEFLIQDNYEVSQAYFDSAKTISNQYKADSSLLIKLLFSESELYKKTGDYDDALNNYFEALKLAELKLDTLNIGLSYYNLSSIYYYMDKLDESETYNLMAQDIYKQINNQNKLIDSYTQYAVICRADQQYDKAKSNLNKVISFYQQTDDYRNLAIALNNLGNIYFEEQNLEKAISSYKEALELNRINNDKYGIAIRYGNIGEAYMENNDFQLANKYIDSSIYLAIEIGAKPTELYNYERLVTFYEKTNNPQIALEYSKKQLNLKLDIVGINTEKLIQSKEKNLKNEIELIKQQTEIELLEKDKQIINEQKQTTQLILLFIIFLVFVALVFTWLFFKKQKRLKNFEQNLMNVKLEKEKLEKENIEKELDYKKQELLNFSQSLIERDKILNRIKQILSHKSENTSKELKQLLNQTNFTDGTELQHKIETINNSFHFHLKQKHPNLTKDDLRLASLILLDLTSKEIANILNIEPKSVDMKRYRLKKKMNLDAKTELLNYLKSIL